MHLDGEESWVEMEDREGHLFKAEVETAGVMPTLKIAEGTVVDAAGLVGEHGDLELLRRLHLRLGHAKGERLLATLAEKGVRGFTKAQCDAIECDACDRINMKRTRVPACADGEREKAFNDVVYQDLIEIPVQSVGGLRYVSVMIDAATRFVSLMALKYKSQAVAHLIKWTRLWQSRGKGKPKVMRTDNGGEFVGVEYTDFCMAEGIDTQTGAPYTPQSQAPVERVNAVVKDLTRKTLIECGLPKGVWPALLPGVANCINEIVVQVTGMSPSASVFGIERAAALHPMALGDMVLVMDPKPRGASLDPKAEVGLFGGVISSAVVSVVIRRDGGWRMLRVHPSAVKLRHWQGEGHGFTLKDGARDDGDAVEVVAEDAHDDDGAPPGLDAPAAAPGPRCVLARCASGAVFPAQVLREGKRRWQVARLERQAGGAWAPAELTDVERQDVLRGFVKEGDGLPADVLAMLGGELPAAPADAHADAGGNPDGEDPGGGDAAVGDDVASLRAASVDVMSDAGNQEEEAGAEDAHLHVEVKGKRRKRKPKTGPPHTRKIVLSARFAGTQREKAKRGVAAARERRTVQEVAKAMAKARREEAHVLMAAQAKTTEVLDAENAAKGNLHVSPADIAAGTHDEAMLKELRRFHELGVLDMETAPPPGVKTLDMRFVHTWKLKDGRRVAKARLVGRGFRDPRDLLLIETYSGTADADLVRVAMLYAISQGWDAAKTDVQTAFLQAPYEGPEVWLKLPQELPADTLKLGYKSGGVYRMKKAVYGTKDAPRIYTRYFKATAAQHGWKEISESLLVKREDGVIVGVMVMHVDDLLVFGSDPKGLLDPLAKELNMDPPEMVMDGKLHTYVGMSLRGHKGKLLIDQSAYVEAIKTGLTETELKKGFCAADLLPPKEEEVDVSLVPEMQKWVGMLGWAVKTQPHLQYMFGELSRWSTKPSAATILAAKKALEFAKSTSRPLLLQAVHGVPKVRVWSDASYNKLIHEGRRGFEVQLVDADDSNHGDENVVGWKSKKIAQKLGSTTSAEMIALKEAVKRAFAFVQIVEVLWGEKPEVEFKIDSQPLLQQLVARQARAEPRFQGELEYIIEMIKELNANVTWVATTDMKADRQTKFLAKG
jgi:transposase InsO family protein